MTDDDKEMATDLPSGVQLRAAARLIERVLIRLDMTQEACECCSAVRYANWEHKKVYDRLTDLPHRLAELAGVLERETEAVRPVRRQGGRT